MTSSSAFPPFAAAYAPDDGLMAARLLEAGASSREQDARIDRTATRRIVEFGPAEGVMTRKMLEILPKDGRIVGIEINEKFVTSLKREKDARLHVIHGSVLDVEGHLAPLETPDAFRALLLELLADLDD